MKNKAAIDQLVSKRISELYIELTDFSEDPNESMQNFLKCGIVSKFWLPILSSIARLEILTNTNAYITTNLIDPSFLEYYELEEDNLTYTKINVEFSNNEKVESYFNNKKDIFPNIAIMHGENTLVFLNTNIA